MKSIVSKAKRGLHMLAATLLITSMGCESGPMVEQTVLELSASSQVVIIGGSTLSTTTPCSWSPATAANVMSYTGGGCLPVTGSAGELGDFTFTPMMPSGVSAASLAAFDTAVLNVASSAMACNTNTLSPSQQADLIAFVEQGNKLIIFDSECWIPQDYSWLPYPFTTANPGALGQPGTLSIVEDNTLSTLIGDPSCTGGDPYCINVSHLGSSTDAVGDMNVMTTYDPHWCVDMSGTNANNVTGPVHTYAKVGVDEGLIIYNGLDMDYLYYDDPHLRKMWVQELQQSFNPSNLPCGVTVVGITLEPLIATNEINTLHTLTATLTDLLGVPQPGITVTFTVDAGPNAGTILSAVTDANGEASVTITSGVVGIDEIVACYTAASGDEVCSQTATKEWILPPNRPPIALCQDVTVSADGECLGCASVDDGSYDPDGDAITVTEAPGCDYGLGTTTVTLTVVDPYGESDTCQGTVTVVDDTPPAIVCNAPDTIIPPDAPISFTATATDNCDASAVVTSYDCWTINGSGRRVDKTESCVVSFAGDTLTVDDSGGVGDHIEWTVEATDGSGNTTTATCEIEVIRPPRGPF